MELLLYTADGCPFCQRAKCLLVEKEVPFREVQVVLGTDAWQDMKQKTGIGSLPQVLIGDTAIGGYSDLAALEASGELYRMLKIVGKGPESAPYDVIILGAGPAGLSAAIYAVRKLLRTVIIGKELGGQIAWTSDVENYLGFSHVNATELVGKFEEHVKMFGIEEVLGTELAAVELTGPLKKVVTLDGRTYTGRTVIIATGGAHRPLNIAGERELVGRGVSYCATCDAPLFKDVEVAVVGGGNSGLEAALNLVDIASKVYLISSTALTGDPLYQDKIRKSEKAELYLEHLPVRIHGESAVQGLEIKNLRTGELTVLSVEGVFVEIGIMPNSSLFLDTLATNPNGEIIVDAECRTGLAGVFACGDVTNVPYKQVVVAVGEGSKAALSVYSYLLNQK